MSDIQMLMPMAGAGSRFAQHGYTLPKPMIPVFGVPMFAATLSVLPPEWLQKCVFLVNSLHIRNESNGLGAALDTYNGTIIEVGGKTDGAARTTLYARGSLDSDKPLLIVNCDQIARCDFREWIRAVKLCRADASILTFKGDDNKYSYACVGDDGFVTKVAEKIVISNNATVGMYYWERAASYFDSVDQMIAKNIRTNGEFYVCPAYNEAISSGLKVTTYDVDVMIGLGTPEDLQNYDMTSKPQ